MKKPLPINYQNKRILMKIPINKGFCVIPPGSRKNLVNTLVCRYTKESSLYNEAPKSAIRQANHYQIITNNPRNHYQL